MAETDQEVLAHRGRLVVRLPNYHVDQPDGRLPLERLARLMRGLGLILGRALPLGEAVEPVLRRADEGSLELVIDLVTAAQDYYREAASPADVLEISAQLATITAAIATVFGVLATVSLQVMAMNRPKADEAEVRRLLLDPVVRRALSEMLRPLEEMSPRMSQPDLVLEMDGATYPVKYEAVDWLLSQAPRPTHRPAEQVLIEVLKWWSNKVEDGAPTISILGSRWLSDPETFLVRDPAVAARLVSHGLDDGPIYLLADIRPARKGRAAYELMRVHQFIGFTFGDGDPDDRSDPVPIRA